MKEWITSEHFIWPITFLFSPLLASGCFLGQAPVNDARLLSTIPVAAVGIIKEVFKMDLQDFWRSSEWPLDFTSNPFSTCVLFPDLHWLISKRTLLLCFAKVFVSFSKPNLSSLQSSTALFLPEGILFEVRLWQGSFQKEQKVFAKGDVIVPLVSWVPSCGYCCHLFEITRFGGKHLLKSADQFPGRFPCRDFVFSLQRLLCSLCGTQL